MELSEIIARTDLVAIIGERIDLRKLGKNHKACCPFHQEKTPSFVAYENSQRYYCFGCGADGDALDFIREYDRLSQKDAIAQIKSYAGVTDDGFKPNKNHTRKIKPDRVMMAKALLMIIYRDAQAGRVKYPMVKQDNKLIVRCKNGDSPMGSSNTRNKSTKTIDTAKT